MLHCYGYWLGERGDAFVGYRFASIVRAYFWEEFCLIFRYPMMRYLRVPLFSGFSLSSGGQVVLAISLVMK